MLRRVSGRTLSTALVAASLLGASAASAAPPTVDPLVALSVFGTAQSRAAVCAAGSQATAAAGSAIAATAASGCVLPVVNAAAPSGTQAPPPMLAPAVVDADGGIGAWPLLLGLAAIAGAALLLLGGDDEADIDIPVSPA